MVARNRKEDGASATEELSRRLHGLSNNTSSSSREASAAGAAGGGLRRRRQPSPEPRPHERHASSASRIKTRRASVLQRLLHRGGSAATHLESSGDSSSSSESDDSDAHSLRRRVSRIFLQRFLKKQDEACEADFCLYFELHAHADAAEQLDGDASNSISNSNVAALKDWVRRRTVSSSRISEEPSDSSVARQRASGDEVHTVIDITAMLLRDAGCHVVLYPLQHADSELLPESKSDAQAYVMTVGYADSGASASETREVPAASAADYHHVHHRPLPEHHRRLPPWVTLHPAYTKHILPLAGLAQTQQLTKLILKECRTDHNLYLASGELVFEAEKPVLRQLARRDDLTVQLYPLHRDSFRESMIRKWARHATYAPPLGDIYQYYGPKIAMYFAWLDFYTRMLVVPSLCGVFVYVAGHFNTQSYSLLSLLLAIGTSVFVDLWRRKQREVEYTWKYQEAVEPTGTLLVPGLVGMDYIETRAEFQGEWMSDPVTHEHIYDFPRHKRLFRQLLAIPLLLSMCCVVGAYVVGLNMLSENLRAHYRPCFLKHAAHHPHHAHHAHGTSSSSSSSSGDATGAPSPALCAFISHGPGVLNALIIYVMDVMYQQLAWRLNEFENYRTAREFEDNLVLKRMPFHFVNSNASIWFLAFYVQNLERVRERLWILMVGMQLLDNFKEVGLPFVVSLTGEFLTADGRRRRHHRSSSSSSSSGGARTSAAVPDSPPPILHAMPELTRQHASLAAAQERLARVLMQKRQAQYKDTFADYKEMMIQYGYVALYSPIFPLAPVFAWLNNVVESRSDFLKLVNTHSYQRPLAEHTRGIGVWEHVLVAFSGLAVIINFALVWTYELDELLPSWSDLHRFMFLVACEHLIFLVKVLLNWAAPDVPTWIQNEKRIAALHRTHEAAYAEHTLPPATSDNDSSSSSDIPGACPNGVAAAAAQAANHVRHLLAAAS